MKKVTVLFFFALFISSLCAQNTQNTMDSVSYSIGILIANNLKNQGIEGVDAASLSAGVRDVLNGNPLKISEEQANMIFQQYAKRQAMKKHESTIAEGQAFLSENKKRAEVNTLPSGLQYEELQAGEGVSPGTGDKVTVHYQGTLINGKEFDSSYKRGEPTTFGVTQVIAGWTEALQLMKPGAKWKVYIPYDLAYGERGAPPHIRPYETLIFTMELIKVN